MRGKVRGGLKGRAGCGITPAHAGKSWGSRSCSGASWDHPRACGEKPKSQEESLQMQGSPPRMRGKVLVFINLLLQLRITPAHAGKRGEHYYRDHRTEDHPRACGEKTVRRTVLFIILGSPPRMRGKGKFMSAEAVSAGITPAHAGKSSRCSS